MVSTKLMRVFTLGLIGVSFTVNAQHRLTPNEPVPTDYSYDDRIENLENRIDELGTSTADGFKEYTLIHSEYEFSEYVTDGQILFGDSMTDYLNDIKDILLADEPRLQREINIYTLKNSLPNAYMTVSGRMMVTTGLISQVQNEAEIAMILAHEISHYKNNDTYRKIDNIFDNLSVFFNTRSNRFTLDAMLDFSKEAEADADKYAFELLVESKKYDPAASIEIFDVLLYSYLPFDEKNFPLEQILPKGIEVDKSLVVETVNAIEANETDDDKSTHPSIKQRRKDFEDLVIEMSESEAAQGTAFPLGEDRFKKVQRLARLETIRRYLSVRQYSKAVYNAQLMMEEYPELKDEMRINTGHALHAIATYKAYDEFKNIEEEADSVQGEIQKVHHFFQNMSDEDASALAISYNFKLHQDFPDNQFVSLILEASIRDMVRIHEKSLEDYCKEVVVEKVDSLSDEEFEALSKIEKIRYQRSLSGENHGWASAMLMDLKDNEELKKMFEDAEELFEEALDDEDRTVNDEKLYVENQYQNSWIDYNEDTDVHLGIDKVVIFEPWIYIYSHAQNGGSIETMNTLEMRETSADRFKIGLNAAGLRYEYLSSQDVRGDFENLADYLSVADFAVEQNRHDHIPVVNSHQREVQMIANKYGTDYILIPNVHTEKAPWIKGVGKNVFLYLFPITSPFAITATLTMQNDNELLLQVIDANRGNVAHRLHRTYEGNLTNALLSQMMYEGAYHIK